MNEHFISQNYIGVIYNKKTGEELNNSDPLEYDDARRWAQQCAADWLDPAVGYKVIPARTYYKLDSDEKEK